MKVYKFFKIPEISDDDIDLESKYILYAITNNKKYAERFKSDRNMKKFIFKEHSGVTKEEYADMCNKDRSAVLDIYNLSTVFDDNHTRENTVTTKVLMTYWEHQIVDEPSTLLDDESLWRDMPYPLVFKKKYIEMLKELQYITYYKLMTPGNIPHHLSDKLSDISDDYAAPSIMYDDVAIFINSVQDTLL